MENLGHMGTDMKAAPLTASIFQPVHRARISLSLVSCLVLWTSTWLRRVPVNLVPAARGGRSMEKQTTGLEIGGPNHATLIPAPYLFQFTSLHLLFRCIHGTGLYRTSLIVTRFPSSRTILPNLTVMH
jgi:hypothetical protein